VKDKTPKEMTTMELNRECLGLRILEGSLEECMKEPGFRDDKSEALLANTKASLKTAQRELERRVAAARG
jgi:hypothetical protein